MICPCSLFFLPIILMLIQMLEPGRWNCQWCEQIRLFFKWFISSLSSIPIPNFILIKWAIAANTCHCNKNVGDKTISLNYIICWICFNFEPHFPNHINQTHVLEPPIFLTGSKLSTIDFSYRLTNRLKAILISQMILQHLFRYICIQYIEQYY
jgi:hypothetical protein